MERGSSQLPDQKAKGTHFRHQTYITAIPLHIRLILTEPSASFRKRLTTILTFHGRPTIWHGNTTTVRTGQKPSGTIRNYLKIATWGPEIADAWLMLARCHHASGASQETRDCTYEGNHHECQLQGRLFCSWLN